MPRKCSANIPTTIYNNIISISISPKIFKLDYFLLTSFLAKSRTLSWMNFAYAGCGKFQPINIPNNMNNIVSMIIINIIYILF
tara:strand:+ start:166 stop:414 length:249 start_codon:yes stop_codon:yes gene_type:complete